jgi:hypothetical protein
MKQAFTSLVFYVLLVFLQGCNKDAEPVCDCNKTEYVGSFTDREGDIRYSDNWRGWEIFVSSRDNQQFLRGKICNLNDPVVQGLIGTISSQPNIPTPVIFSGRVTELCPDEYRPIALANVSFFYTQLSGSR